MPSNFKVEHVARVPRGWKVRTVTQGDHQVRIAFPAGRRREDSGHVVEILHPKHENPSLCPARSRMSNPAELVLMGANPLTGRPSRTPVGSKVEERKQERIREQQIAAARKESRPVRENSRKTAFTESEKRELRRIHLKPSHYTTPEEVQSAREMLARLEEIREKDRSGFYSKSNSTGSRFAIHWNTGNISHAMRTQEEAEKLLSDFHHAGTIIRVNPMPLSLRTGSARRFSNPAELESREAETAREIRDGFVDRKTERYLVLDEPHIPAGDYAELGKLHSLGVLPTSTGSSRQAQELYFGAATEIRVISDTSRTQIYFAGGRQDLSAGEVAAFTNDDFGVVKLGECRDIVYVATKYHPEVGNDAAGRLLEWHHKFGEDTGARPSLWYDVEHRRLLLRGGAYRVEDAGIVN